MPAVVVPSTLVSELPGRTHVQLAPGPRTVGQVLLGLFERHPRLRERILTEQGELREHLNVFVGGRNVRFASGLATEVADDAQIFVLPSVSGG